MQILDQEVEPFTRISTSSLNKRQLSEKVSGLKCSSTRCDRSSGCSSTSVAEMANAFAAEGLRSAKPQSRMTLPAINSM
jgi:hypothetical protein